MKTLKKHRAKGRVMSRDRGVHLYWVATADHEEDWFIFARTSRSAAKFHEEFEGYGRHYASARKVLSNLELPKPASRVPCHAQMPDLEALGFQVLDPGRHPTVMTLAGEFFVEGFYEVLVPETRREWLKALRTT